MFSLKIKNLVFKDNVVLNVNFITLYKSVVDEYYNTGSESIIILGSIFKSF